MVHSKMPPVDAIRRLIQYHPETGLFFWNERLPSDFDAGIRTAELKCHSWNSRFSGKEALTALNRCGYKHGHILSIKVIAHRLAWAISTGKWPEHEIDHINMVRHDNRLQNLRHVTRSQNACNRSILPRNMSGYKGVLYDRRNGRCTASIAINGKSTYLGSFATPEEAHAAYCEAAAKIHGVFMRTS